MRLKHWLYTLLGVAVAAIAIYFAMNNQSSTIKTQLRDFAVEDTASVTKIFLADKADNTILLERQDDGTWKVNDTYLVRPDVINNLLGTINTITLRAPVSKAMFESVVRRLAGNSTKVEIYQNNEGTPSKVYFVGSSNQDHTGTFMLMENSSIPFVMHVEGHYGFLGSRYSTHLNDWRSNTLWSFPGEKLKTIASIKVDKKRVPNMSFEIKANETNGFDLYDYQGKKVQGASADKIIFYVKQYESVSYEGFEETKNESFKDSIISNIPVKEVFTVTTKDGKVISIETYDKPIQDGKDYEDNDILYDMDRMYGLINKEHFVIIQYFVFDPLNVDITFFKP